MPYTSTRQLAFALLFAIHSAAIADNHIFYNGAPLLTVTRTGSLEPLSLTESNGLDKPRVMPALKRAIKSLFAPGETRTDRRVIGFKIDPGYGCTEPDQVILSDKLPTDGVLSTKPLAAPKHPGVTRANPHQRQQAVTALDTVLRNEKSLSSQQRDQLIKSASINVVKLDASGLSNFIVEAELQAQGAASVNMMIILTPDKSGKLNPTFTDVRIGGPSDSDGYAGRQSFVDHIDLDGDGVDELLVSHTGYESASIKVYQRQGPAWVEVADGVGTGC